MVMPTRRAGNPGEVTSYLELINWMLRRHVEQASVATFVETLNVAFQRDDEDELSFAEQLRRHNTECGFMYGEGALKGRFMESVHRAARATVRERNTPGMTMAELARVAQTKADEHRWLRLEQLRERTKEREVLAEEARLWRQARAAALPRISGGLGVTHREMPRFGSSGLWTPPRHVAGHGARRPDPRHQTARLPEAVTTHAAGFDSEMSLPVPNPGRESTVAGSEARWVIGPRCAQPWTHAYATDWRRPCAVPLSRRPRAPEKPSRWADGWQLPPPTRTPAEAAMSRRRLRRGNLGPSPRADQQPPLSPKRETSNHRCWALPAATGGPSSGRGCDASTHPIPTQGDPPSGCTPPEGAGRPECGGHPDGVQLSGGQPHLVGREA